MRPGLKAFDARCSRTAESLPPLKSRTGRSDSAATSRMMKMASDSSRSRWPRAWPKGRTRAVTDAPDCADRPGCGVGPTDGRARVVAMDSAVSTEPLQIMTNLVMYTLVCIPSGVKPRVGTPEGVLTGYGRGSDPEPRGREWPMAESKIAGD